MQREQADEAFVAEVHRALTMLYNPDALRDSPLLDQLVATRRSNPVGALRQVLTEGVAALKPGARVPPHAWAWRAYQVLTYRFIEQGAQKQVAADLSLSVRQLRRAEERAVRVLADYLWNRYALRGEVAQPAAAEEAGTDPTNELVHLSELPSGEMCDLAQIIPAILRTVQPLLDLRSLVTRVALAEPLPEVTGSSAIVRQMLLNLLTLAASAAQDDLIDVQAMAEAGQVMVRVCVPVRPDRPCVREVDTAETVAVTQALAQLAGGTATVAERPDGVLDCRLTLPTIPAIRLLAIDDNADMLRLIERFLQGSPYSVVGVSDPQTAVHTAEAIAPRFILLDIMLPEIDGWELLGRLREHPQLGNVPVIVCTFLPQDQLAATVGAAAFLRKPITREALLAVLDHLVQSPTPEAPSGR